MLCGKEQLTHQHFRFGSTGKNTTGTVTILSERRQHRNQMAQPKTSKQDDEEDDVFTKKDMVTKNEKLDR